MSRRRSWLFVPADDDEKIAKFSRWGADVAILDLEDGVARARKPLARGSLAARIATLSGGDATVAVRINGAWRDAVADLDAAIGGGARHIVVPKVEDAARLGVIGQMCRESEAVHGLPDGAVTLSAMIESPAGVLALDAIATVERVTALAFGSEDFSLALGVAPTSDCLDLPCRQTALVAAARGIDALAIPMSIAAFRDEDALDAAARRAAAFGATGGLCIHPRQVQILNAVYACDPAQRDHATRLLEAWRAGDGEACGIVSWEHGMIDRPMVARASRLLANS